MLRAAVRHLPAGPSPLPARRASRPEGTGVWKQPFPGRSLVRLRNVLDLGDSRNVLELFPQRFRFWKIF